MFFLNLGYRWGMASDLEEIRNVIFLPQGNDISRLSGPIPDSQRTLIDPQLYLSWLDPKECLKTCIRLASYPWFGISGVPEYNETRSRKEWEGDIAQAVSKHWTTRKFDEGATEDSCRKAVWFQAKRGCSHIILPSPLAVDREDEAQTQADWLDKGIGVAQEMEVSQPLLATIALSENILNDASSKAGGYLETIVDQYAARKSDLHGAYIVIVQSELDHPFNISKKVRNAYLYLSKTLSKAGFETIVVNFADVFGLACLAVGATAMATGPTQSIRRISLAGFKDNAGGTALPHFYSHKTLAEFLPENDLGIIAKAKLIRRISDVTPYSESLLEAIDQGQSAATVDGWVESKNNTTTSNKHFISRILEEAESLTKSGRGRKRFALVRNWLEDADVNATYIRGKLTKIDLERLKWRTAGAADWLEELDSHEV